MLAVHIIEKIDLQFQIIKPGTAFLGEIEQLLGIFSQKPHAIALPILSF